jgi:hypothetical protein
MWQFYQIQILEKYGNLVRWQDIYIVNIRVSEDNYRDKVNAGK